MVEKIKVALERAYRERENPATTLSKLLKQARVHEIDPQRLLDKRVIAVDETGEHSALESYRLLRTHLLSKLESGQLSSIGITSANAGEGKTLTALNLAISLAKAVDSNVMLVDGDVMSPSIHKLLDINPDAGLVDLLNGKVKLDDVIIRTRIPNLWFVTGRNSSDGLLDQSGWKRIKSLIQVFAANHRNIVVVDLPPVLVKEDAYSLAAHLDGIILVVDCGETTSDEVLRAQELLKQNNLIGSVLNKYSHS